MKKAIVTVALIGFIGMTGIGNAWAGWVSERQERQENRIVNGIRSGELTRRETRELLQEQYRIERFKSRAWSDGRLTPNERKRLTRRLDRASRHIYELKHNRKIWR